MKNRLIPLIALTGCLKVNDGQVPAEKRKECAAEMTLVAETCRDANVIGQNENAALYAAMSEARECLQDWLITCSDTDSFKIVTYTPKNER